LKPFMIPELPNRMMNGDELRAIGKGGFGLHVVNHLGDTFHHIGLREDGRAEAHQFRHRLPIAGAFEDLVGDDRDRFGIIQLQSPLLTPARKVGGDHDEKFFLVARREMHGVLLSQWMQSISAVAPRKAEGDGRFAFMAMGDCRASVVSFSDWSDYFRQ
jgi:hypothetical protein